MRTTPALAALPACIACAIGWWCLALPATAAEPTACEAKYKEVAPAAIKLPYREFDQSEAGWRKLGNCFSEASMLLGRYVRKQESELRGVRWHLAQTLAMSGENERAAEEALKSLEPDEARHPTFSWNTYALATVAFLRQDRAAFDVQYEAHRIATEKHPENRTNLDVLTGLANCFGKPYREAYGNCRAAP